MMTLLSSAPVNACSEMSAEMIVHSQDSTTMHLHDMQPPDVMAVHSSMATTDMNDCEGGCTITCMVCSASIQESPAVLTNAKFHNNPIQQKFSDQVLAAHNARNLRPPIS